MPEPRRKSRVTRDFVLFTGGFLGIAYETLIGEVERPALLAVFAGMVGLPAFLRKDEKSSDESKPPPPETGE